MQHIIATYTVEYLETCQFAIERLPDNFSTMTLEEQFDWLDENALLTDAMTCTNEPIETIRSIHIAEED